MIHAQDTETYKDHRVHTFSGMHQRQPLLGRGGGNPSRETRTSNSEGFLRQEVSLPLLQGQVPSERQSPDSAYAYENAQGPVKQVGYRGRSLASDAGTTTTEQQRNTNTATVAVGVPHSTVGDDEP